MMNALELRDELEKRTADLQIDFPPKSLFGYRCFWSNGYVFWGTKIIEDKLNVAVLYRPERREELLSKGYGFPDWSDKWVSKNLIEVGQVEEFMREIRDSWDYFNSLPFKEKKKKASTKRKPSS